MDHRRDERSMAPCSFPAAKRNWADLGDGPAGLIADRVLAHDVAGYIRFRAVCRSWRRCCSVEPPRAHIGPFDRRFHPRRWVMLREPLAAPHRRRFLNTSTGECVQVDIPELRDHEVLAPTAEGLLLLLRARNHVRLLNPLTGQLVRLPPLTTLLPAMYRHRLSVRNYHFATDFLASGSGIAHDDSTVVLCFYALALHMIGVARPGDQSWTLLKFRDPMRSAPLMFAGRFYCVTIDGVMVLEMGPPRLVVAAKLHMPFSLEMDSAHLVDNGGELMLVHRKFLPFWAEFRRSYEVYRVDLGNKTLFAVDSLGGGRALFMGMYCSLSVHIEGFPSGSIRADTIYLRFDVDERDRTEAYHLTDRSISPASGYNLDGFLLQPHTLAECLSLCNTDIYEDNIVGFEEDWH